MSETSAQLIFFIAATVLAAAVSTVLTGVVSNAAAKLEEKGTSLGQVLTTDITIINDPSDVPNNPVLLYVQNTGQMTLTPSLLSVILDGTSESFTSSLQGGATEWETANVVQLTVSTNLAAGDHQVHITTENGVSADLRFRE